MTIPSYTSIPSLSFYLSQKSFLLLVLNRNFFLYTVLDYISIRASLFLTDVLMRIFLFRVDKLANNIFELA